ncbi:MAG: hypothetical protein LBS95_01780 [Mycoplasmataceae bacterium]|jgi:hypothetical protein|nr:hypothetical protein [Mycoplasmataceae bacterium]
MNTTTIDINSTASKKKTNYTKNIDLFIWIEIVVMFMSLLLEMIMFCVNFSFTSAGTNVNNISSLVVTNIIFNTLFSLVWICVTGFNLYVYLRAHAHKKNGKYLFWNKVLDGPFKLVINMSLILSTLVFMLIAFNGYMFHGTQIMGNGVVVMFPIWMTCVFCSLIGSVGMMILAYHYRKEEYIIN